MNTFYEAFKSWMDDRTKWKCKVPSKSQDDVMHTVRLMDEGYWRCDCRSTQECRHIKIAQKYYEQNKK